MHHNSNPNYIHHQDSKIAGTIRELVFGMEDGMVSTLGAITGIAAATQDYFLVLLAGCVVVSVESISMAVGSYLSTKSEKSIDERKLEEEREELKKFPAEEKAELIDMYVKDGWTKDLAIEMAEEASQNHELFLQEMAYRELKVFPDNMQQPFKNGLVMGVSYIFGGIIPLAPYFFFDIGGAITVSIIITLIGLFSLGAFVATYSKRSWIHAGIEMATLAGVAALVGYGVGQLIERFIG